MTTMQCPPDAPHATSRARVRAAAAALLAGAALLPAPAGAAAEGELLLQLGDSKPPNLA